MKRWEKTILVVWAVALIVWIPMLLLIAVREPQEATFLLIFAGQIIVALAGWGCVALTICDLYKRSFPNPNSKLTWLLQQADLAAAAS